MKENREDIPQVSDIENELLMEAFTEKEIKEVIFQMEHNKAPGSISFFLGHHRIGSDGAF